MIEFFIKQHKLMNLILVGVITVGINYFVNGQKEGFPNIGLDQIYINTVYPGVSAKDIDALITSKIEDAVKSVEGTEDITSTSSQGISIILITVDTVNSGLNLNEVSRKVKDQVDLIKKDLPSDLPSDPLVQTISFGEVIPIIQVFIAGNRDFNELKKIAEDFDQRAVNISGVSKVEKSNYPKTQVLVSVDPEKLKQYDIDISEVTRSVQNANINLPSGTIKHGNEEFLVKTVNPLSKISEIEDIVIRGNDNFQTIRLKDVANSSLTPEELSQVVESDGNAGVGVSVYKKLSGDVIKTATAVKELVKEYQELYPDLKIFYIRDISFYVERRLKVLTNNATIGLILVFLCLIIFFEFRVTFWTTLGIPVALCFAIIVCYQLGITLNLMSMFGFIIVIGMLVDDAIIVSENIYQKYEKGIPLMEAAITGTKEMLIPILAIVATSMASFLPLMTLPGIFGKVLGIIPQVVVLALLASFIESFLILPAHIAFMKDRNRGRKKWQEEKQRDFLESPYNLSPEAIPTFANVAVATVSDNGKKVRKNPKEKRQWFNAFRNGYTSLLTKLTRRPILTSLVILIISVAVVGGLGSRIPFVFFPGEAEDIVVNIETNKKSTLDKTQLVVRELEKQLRAKLGNEVREYFSTSGSTMERDQGRVRVRSHVANVYMNLTPTAERKLSVSEITKIVEETAAAAPGVENSYAFAMVGGPPPGNPIEISLFFSSIDSMDRAEQLSEKILNIVSALPNTSSEAVSYEQGKEEITLLPNPVKAAAYGVGIEKIGSTAGLSFRSTPATTINSFIGVDEEVDVLVKLDEKVTDETTVTNLLVKNRLGRNTSVHNFVNVSSSIGEGRINKENGRYNVRVTAQLENLRDQANTAEKLNRQITDKYLPEWRKEFPEGEIKLGGQQEEQQELIQGGIRALLLSIFGVLVVLVAIFRSYLQPLIIISILPFILVGAIIGLFINSVPLGLMPFLGIIALTGVVVNDSIVMVDLINKKKEENHTRPLREVVVEAAGQRLRAIMMTTITTIVGLIPTAYGLGGAEPFISPMAITFLWGMVFSSTMILFLIPNFYLIIDKIRYKIKRDENLA